MSKQDEIRERGGLRIDVEDCGIEPDKELVRVVRVKVEIPEYLGREEGDGESIEREVISPDKVLSFGKSICFAIVANYAIMATLGMIFLPDLRELIWQTTAVMSSNLLVLVLGYYFHREKKPQS